MTIGTQLAWDDTVLPFQLDLSDIRGRVARLDGTLDRVLKQHNYPVADEALVAEACLITALIGANAPSDFMQHFIVFVLAVFIGFSVIWNVSHALHTPLMSVTNAISGIVILGALLQIGSGNWLVVALAAVSVLIASINVVGGFLVTRRMLAMFQKS